MRTIQIPTLVLIQEPKVDFKWFVLEVLNRDSRFNQTGTGIRAAIRIEKSMEKAIGTEQSMESFFLEEADWKILSEAVEDPSAKEYPISPARKLAPFIEAILEAK